MLCKPDSKFAIYLSFFLMGKGFNKLGEFKGIRNVSQKVVPLHNGFMTLLCNYLCDIGYFDKILDEITGLLHNRIRHPIKMNYVFNYISKSFNVFCASNPPIACILTI